MGYSEKIMIFCDFDGTITTDETFVGALKCLCEESNLHHWFEQLLQNKITLRQCTENLFSSVLSSEYTKLMQFTETVQVQKGFDHFLEVASSIQIPVVVISGGIQQMVDIVLEPYRNKIQDVYACQLNTEGTYMKLLSKFPSETENMCKELVMAQYNYTTALCIGDQLTDYHMADHCQYVFAKDGLAEYMKSQGRSFFPWRDFYDIVDILSSVDFSLSLGLQND